MLAMTSFIAMSETAKHDVGEVRTKVMAESSRSRHAYKKIVCGGLEDVNRMWVG